MHKTKIKNIYNIFINSFTINTNKYNTKSALCGNLSTKQKVVNSQQFLQGLTNSHQVTKLTLQNKTKTYLVISGKHK